MTQQISTRGADGPAEEARAVAGYERNAPDHDFAFERGQQLSQLLETAGDVDELERKRDRCHYILSLRHGPSPRKQRNQVEYRGDGQPVGSPPPEVL
ncbi:hypothetical protein [Natrinema soli]|uniref:Uncharacterized protein n=1 Tax=Natrinema soli TaxID=1930624 RepID=A0ABD5SMS2_9EURY|nr:hypothetical protein [Natrinema soli]